MKTRSPQQLRSPLCRPLKEHCMAAIWFAMVENTSTGSTSSSDKHESETMNIPTATPVLQSADSPVIPKFLKKRKTYQLKVELKKAELPLLQKALYFTSIDRSLLDNLVSMGAFEDFKINLTAKALTDENIEEFIKSLLSNESDEVNPAQLRETTKRRKFLSHAINSSPWVKTFCANVFDRLWATRYEDFRLENPRYTNKIMIKRIRRPALKNSIGKPIRLSPVSKITYDCLCNAL